MDDSEDSKSKEAKIEAAIKWQKDQRYWTQWRMKAERANEIIRNLKPNPYGADILWGYGKWFKNLINIDDKE